VIKNKITAPEQVKPNFTNVKERWKNLLSKYYTSDGKLNNNFIIDVDCPHCASKKREKSFELNAFHHHFCVDCECLYVSPRLNNAALEELYADEYYSEMYSKSMIPFFDKRKELIGKSKYSQVIDSIESVRQNKSKSLRVLDIGAGIGEVISVFNDNGHDCEAIEVNSTAIDQLKNIGIKVFEGSFYNYDLNEKFDVIMAWGVVEHITDPSLFLSKVYSLLKPAGVFVSEVPHSQSVLVDYCQKTGKDPLRILQGEQHIILYSNKAYSELHEKSGLQLHQVQTNGLDISTIFSINDQEIDQDVKADIQSSMDDLMKGDLLRGFWFR
jgi:2-polyprenyl-3-methyl-5-hydroxy-6-metoxy-1,4-benzoquinol methylase